MKEVNTSIHIITLSKAYEDQRIQIDILQNK